MAFPAKDLVVLNPSLDPRAIVRDAVFHCVAKRIFRRKTLVFFRGWDLKFERIIDNHWRKLFRFLFEPDKVLVLGTRFKKALIMWGFDAKKIVQETTTFEEHKFSMDKNRFKIIFLSRLTKQKGCLEALQTIEALADEYPNVKLYMVGEGEMMPTLRKYVIDHNLTDNVEFTGWLQGRDKYFLLEQCGIMLCPTYGEGLPNSLVQGMGMGLAVVATPVGGIPDIFVDGENGFLGEYGDPKDFAMKVKALFENAGLWRTMCCNNSQKAKEKFEIKNVIRRMEQIYFETAN
jgi:glycosyltransferase involved in cell wall biosynthesis